MVGGEEEEGKWSIVKMMEMKMVVMKVTLLVMSQLVAIDVTNLATRERRSRNL
jgi:hypothetical protein